MAATVLVVDDDPDTRRLVGTLLERAGHRVASAGDGSEALKVAYDRRPDLVLLDVDMPGKDGWATLAALRELSEVPVMMLTAHGAELERVRGLRAGADDYVTKPFGRQELIARVDVLLRRAARDGRAGEADAGPPAPSDDGFLRIDHARKEVTAAGKPVKLTPLELRFLEVFAAHPRQVLSRQQLADLVWTDELPGSLDQVKVYVGYVRRKIAEASGRPAIETVRGFGYLYEPEG